MVSWKDDKNLGPWKFTKQPNKPSYNEGDHIATYANPVWSMEEGSNVPITPTHNPCGYWTKDYVPPPLFSPPKEGYLIGWYKVNEGSGLIVANSATDGSSGGGLFPDLDVKNNNADFWTAKTGFGSTSLTTPSNKVSFAIGNPNRNLGSVASNTHSFGIFLYKHGTALEFYLLSTKLLNDSSGDYGWRISINNYFSGKARFVWGDTIYGDFDPAALTNAWSFWFISLPYGYVVKSDGTLITVSIGNKGSTRFHYIQTGIGYDGYGDQGYYAAKGSYGDWIIYNNTNITLAEWAAWYDQLRSRYGMAARSGW